MAQSITSSSGSWHEYSVTWVSSTDSTSGVIQPGLSRQQLADSHRPQWAG